MRFPHIRISRSYFSFPLARTILCAKETGTPPETGRGLTRSQCEAVTASGINQGCLGKGLDTAPPSESAPDNPTATVRDKREIIMNTNTLTRISTLTAAIGLAFSANSWAVTQDVSYQVPEIAVISLGTPPEAMVLEAPTTPGTAPGQVEATSSYDITNNAGDDSKKIMASIDADMPTGVTLEVQLASPGGTTAQPKVALSDAPTAVLTGIDSISKAGNVITYYLNATLEAAAMASADTRTVTFTIQGN